MYGVSKLLDMVMLGDSIFSRSHSQHFRAKDESQPKTMLSVEIFWYGRIPFQIPAHLRGFPDPCYTGHKYLFKYAIILNHKDLTTLDVDKAVLAFFEAMKPPGLSKGDPNYEMYKFCTCVKICYAYNDNLYLEVVFGTEVSKSNAKRFFDETFKHKFTAPSDKSFQVKPLEKEPVLAETFCLVYPEDTQHDPRTIARRYFEVVPGYEFIELVDVDIESEFPLKFLVIRVIAKGNQLPPKGYRNAVGYPGTGSIDLNPLKRTLLFPVNSRDYCTYCRQKDHWRDECPKLPTCPDCLVNDHFPGHCIDVKKRHFTLEGEITKTY